jgi:predicted nucleotidyltransferase
MDMASQTVLGLVEEKLQIQHSGEGQGDLYTDQLPLPEAAGFDVTIAGAQLLGKDARRIASEETAASITKLLADPD